MTWLDRIKLAKQTDKFTKKDKTDCQFLYNCAVGERLHLDTNRQAVLRWLVDSIGKEYYIARLRLLGVLFELAVKNDGVQEAEEIYTEIHTVELPME